MLGDTRARVREQFWAARECGLHEHESFWNWYIGFIEHFIVVYERRAASMLPLMLNGLKMLIIF
jgi:hypothetical protein